MVLTMVLTTGSDIGISDMGSIHQSFLLFCGACGTVNIEWRRDACVMTDTNRDTDLLELSIDIKPTPSVVGRIN